MKNRIHATRWLASLVLVVSSSIAPASTLYWDLNGTTANTAVAVTGAWNGTNAFWNTSSSGSGGAAQAATTSNDDLVFSSGTNLTTGTITASNTRVASSITFEDNVIITLAGPVRIGGAGTKSGIFVAAGKSTATTVSSLVTLIANATVQPGAALLTHSGGFDLGSNTLAINVPAAGRVSISAPITGMGSVTISGTGTGDYDGSAGGVNTYSGGATLNPGGTVAIGANSLGPAGSPTSGTFGTGTLTLAGGQLRSGTGGIMTVGNPITVTGNTTFYTSTSEKSLVLSGPITLSGGDRTLTSTVGTTVAGTSVIVNGAIGDGGNVFGITKAGAGNLTFNGTNTYTGITTISAGALSIGTTGSLPGWNANGQFAVASGATLTVQNGLTDGEVNTLVGTTNFANGATLGFDTTLANRNYALNLTDTTQGVLNLAKLGANTLTLFGSNSYTGTTTVASGTLQFVSASALYNGNTASWTPGNISVTSGATLAVNLGGAGDFTAPQVSALLTNLSTVSNNGLRAGAAFGFDTTNAVGEVTYNQVLTNSTGTGGGAIGFTKLGAGTLISNQPNTYTGTTTVNNDTLVLAGNRTAPATTISVGTTPSQAGVLNLTNGDFTLTNVFSVGTGDSTVTGIVNQTGGTLRLTNTQLLVGNGAGGTTPGTSAFGTYNLSSGILTGAPSTGRGIILGVNSGATGTFSVSDSGNLAMPLSNLQVGRADSSNLAGTSGIFNQTGGTAVIGYLNVAGGGTTHTGTIATMNLTGGSFSATNFPQLSSGASVTAQITLGGTAQVTLPAFPTARGAASTATLIFDGGTLIPAAASTTYLGGLTNAFVKAGGAKFNVAATNDITVTQALVPDVLSPGGGLTKLGNGTLTLAGDSTYTGLTTVTAGTLAVTGTLVGTSGLSVANGGTFAYLPPAPTTLALGGGSLNLATNSTVAATFGSTIASPAAAVVGSWVNLTLSGPFNSGTPYSILTATSGLNSASYQVLNPTDYLFTMSVADNAVQITPTSATPLSEASWVGGFVGNPGVWAASNGLIGSNWKSGGVATGLVPGTAASILFDGAGDQLNMTLGTSMAINGMNVTSANEVSLLRDGVSTLTIGSTGISISAGAGAVTLNPDIDLSSAQTWLNNGSNPLTLGGTVSNGSNLLTLDGSGNTTIANFNGGSGGLTSPLSALGTVALTTASPNGAQTWTNNGANPISIGALTAGNAVLTLAGSNSFSIGAIVNNTTNFGLAVGTGNAVVNGTISGTGGLAKSGAGMLTLSSTNTYSGATSVTGGVLVPMTSGAFGTADLGTTQSGASEIRLTGGVTIAEPLSINGGGITDLGTVRNFSGDNTWSGPITMAAQSRINSDSGTLTLNAPVAVASNNFVIVLGGAGKIDIPGTLALGTGGVAKSGTGTVTLSGANTYTGITKVDSGTLIASGTSAGAGAITVGSVTTAPAVLSVVSGGTLTGSTLSVGTVANSTGAVNLTGGNLLLAAQETQDGIAFGGAEGAYGALHMSSGVFTQSRLMFGGIGTATTNGGIGVGLVSGGTINSNGWFILARAGASTGILTVTGGTINHANASQTLSLGLSGSGRAELNVAGGLIDNTGRNVTFSSGTGGTFFWTGTGLLNLNAGTLVANAIVYDAKTTGADASSYINFSGGTLKASISSPAFLPAFTSTGAGINRVFVNGPFGTFAGGAVIDTDGFDATIGANLLAPSGDGVTSLTIDDAGSGYVGAPAVKILDGGQPSTATAYATVGTDPGNPATFGKLTSIVITNPGVITGIPSVSLIGGGGSGAVVSVSATGPNTSGGLTKVGAGTLRLNGTNTYTGTTTVTAGTLGGTGSLVSPLIVSVGAAIAPGASTGTFTSGAATLAGTYVCEIDGLTADKLVVNGTLNVSAATLDLDVLAGGATEPSYVIASYTGSTPAPFLSIVDPIPGYSLVYNYNDGISSNNIALVKSASPYNTWASSFGLDPATDGAPGIDKDGDGESNAVEYALGSSPVSGSSRAKIFNLIADGSVDADTTNELLITIAVRAGTPAFSGSPSPVATNDGITYKVQGSTTLDGFPGTVTPVAVVVPPAPNATPPTGYEYRTFSLDGSNGLTNKGFLRVEIAP